MQLNTRIFLAISIILTLSACSGGGGSSSPQIGKIYTDIYHRHSSFYDKWGITPNRRISFTISAAVSDPQGITNLDYIYVQDKNRYWYWDLLNTEDGFTLDECYISELEIFECTFYNSDTLDSVNLEDWILVAIDKEGNKTQKAFEFVLPGGETMDAEEIVYSSEYNGPISRGIEALEALTITNNNIVFSSNPSTQSFHIEFEPKDDRAKHYSFAFYDDTRDLNYIGYVCSCSQSIESTPIVFGHKVVIDIPWSEIEFMDGATAEDIYGLHIKLYDEPIDWEPPTTSGVWFNYISHSEFITLD